MSFAHRPHVPRQRRRSSVSGARGEGGNAPTRRAVQPERLEVQLGKLTFDSNFENGNGHFEVDSGTYCVWTQADCAGTEYENGNRSWFHFSVCGAAADQTITLRVCGMNKLKYLYDRGMRAVYRREPSMKKYERVPEQCNYSPDPEGASLQWKHKFTEAGEKVFFAFTYPYTYTQLLQKLDLIEQKAAAEPAIYFHSELLCQSPQGRDIQLLTMSSTEGLMDALDPPLARQLSVAAAAGSSRAKRFTGKQVVFVSSRVHPGEVPAQWVLDGWLQFVMHSTDPRAIAFRDTFVLKVIPMLNPDGVAMGHYRSDCYGVNLNRCYGEPSEERAPSIVAATEVMRQLVEQYGAGHTFYFDLHAHANKRGCFMYGNHFEDPAMAAYSMMIPKLTTLNSQHFHFDQCNFTVENMKKIDKRDGDASKEGSGRVSMHHKFDVVQSYTLECNYNDGPYVNDVPPIESMEEQCPSSRRRPAHYNPAHFADVGKGIALACLDCVSANPHSRIPGSVYGSLGAINEWLMGPQNVHGAGYSNNNWQMLPEVTKPKHKLSGKAPKSERGVQAQKITNFSLPSPGSAAE